ncbi:alkaline phosphatase, tissue-nonspecific isozyme-like [Palaemon carinicauda]|uniref:alkaline phosphatase, tissue-nonspecific isozyme-like n=1 Tax=Palaemon carinicauda TaxID=392227 RepID=UPI0035B5F510
MAWTVIMMAFMLVLCLPKSLAWAELEDRHYWYNQAKEQIEELLTARRTSNGYAKNVILFVGDGMGVSTVTAGRILKGQRLGQSVLSLRDNTSPIQVLNFSGNTGTLPVLSLRDNTCTIRVLNFSGNTGTIQVPSLRDNTGTMQVLNFSDNTGTIPVPSLRDNTGTI